MGGNRHINELVKQCSTMLFEIYHYTNICLC